MILDFLKLSVCDLARANLEVFYSKQKRIIDDRVHLTAAIEWLIRSIEKSGTNGSSKGYTFGLGWRPPYPETSGYIIRTLVAIGETRDKSYLKKAQDIGDWLLSIQSDNGSVFQGPLGTSRSAGVFNTGQVLLGMNCLYAKTQETRFLKSGIRAGEFLVSCLDEHGCFIRHLFNNIVHAYNARVGWALIELGVLSSRDDFAKSGNQNIHWTIRQQQENGFFLHNNFKKDRPANLHSIAYVLRGILESYFLTGNKDYLDAVLLTTEALLRKYGINKKLRAEIDTSWKNLSSHICLTGYAQLSIILMKVFQINKDLRYLNMALHLVDDLKSYQYLGDRHKNYNGAIKGSFPIYGRYAPLQFPNWATKFFIDALVLKMEVLKDYENSTFK